MFSSPERNWDLAGCLYDRGSVISVSQNGSRLYTRSLPNASSSLSPSASPPAHFSLSLSLFLSLSLCIWLCCVAWRGSVFGETKWKQTLLSQMCIDKARRGIARNLVEKMKESRVKM